ncbi:dynamin family protein [Herbihabitans rhizosphaerae]|uniref:Dynamin family protein n=1 Tax=Herbihabitans rhizosphaerae TaxID=1872711 RepID=A0A4Q7KPU7_9PSEU|nr:dynamin family protein [Herbihabitans rhizosphaerae]RZS37721.1 dynamin family protein [Herbihabitans rhizosphaerae]
MTDAAPIQTVSLPTAVAQARDKLLTLVREADSESAKWVEEIRARRKAKPTIVVVGETNRGKSSLVNAVLAKPGLSPVDADVATATYLVFGHAAEWEARACYPGQLAPVPVDLAKLVNWVSAAHPLPDGEIPPRYVEVDGPVPLLERLTVVDTPGVGGLDSIHGELALEAAEQATALLFVVDASAPFTVGELNFLQQVGDRVETVIFALSKVDQFRGWRQVLQANLDLLAEHAPRFAGAKFYPVSARMFEMADKAPNQQAATMLRERSGVIELQTETQELLLGRAKMLAEANTLRALSTTLAELRVKLEAEQRALTTGESEAESLRGRRDELTVQRRSSTRGWQLRLRGEIQRTRVEASHEVARQMRDVQAWFRQAMDGAKKDQLTDLPAEVDAALQLASGRVSAQLGERLTKLTENALGELFSADELSVIRAQFARADRPPIMIRPPEKRPPTAEDKLFVFMGVTGGVGIGRAAMSMIPLGLSALNPITLIPGVVVGLGAGWWMSRTRKHSADKQHMKQWLTEAIADARSTLDQLVSEQLIEAEQQLSLALDDALGKRIDAIEDELREVDKALRLGAVERSKRLQVVNQRLSEVTSGRERAENLLETIRTVRDSAR